MNQPHEELGLKPFRQREEHTDPAVESGLVWEPGKGQYKLNHISEGGIVGRDEERR